MYPLISLLFGLILLSGCSQADPRSSGITSISIDALSPLATGTASQWTYWVKKDATVLPETTGTQMCAGTDAGAAYDTCVNAGLTRKVKITAVDSCSTISSMEDSLGVFEWTCVASSDATGVWIYSSGFAEDKGIGDLVDDFATSTWKSLVLTVKTSSATYISKSTVPWTDTLTAAPDSSASRASFSTQGSLYYLDADTTGFGFSVDADNVGFLMKPDVTYTFAATGTDSVLMVIEHSFVTFSGGTYDGAGQADAIVQTAGTTVSSKFLFANDMVLTNADYGILIAYQLEDSTFSNIESSGHTGGVLVASTGSNYLAFQNISAHDNTANGFDLEDTSLSSIIVSDLTAYSNDGDGVLVNGATDAKFYSLTLYDNDDGLFAASTTNLSLVSVTTHDNATSGLDIGNGSTDLTASGVVAYSNGLHGVFANNGGTGITLTQVVAYSNTEAGIMIYGGVTDASLTSAYSYNNGTYGIRAAGGLTNFQGTNFTIQGSGTVGLSIADGVTGADVDTVTIQSSGADGLEVDSTTSTTTVTVKNATIYDCEGNGVVIANGSKAEFTTTYVDIVDDALIYGHDGAEAVFNGFSCGTNYDHFLQTDNSTIEVNP